MEAKAVFVQMNCYCIIAEIDCVLYIYIGITTDCIKRWEEHIKEGNWKMKDALSKATRVWSKVIGMSFDINTILTMEAKLIQYYNSTECGLNISHGHYGKGTADGIKFIDVEPYGRSFKVKLNSTVLCVVHTKELGQEFVDKIIFKLNQGSNVLVKKRNSIIVVYYKDYLIFSNMKIVNGNVQFDIPIDDNGNPIVNGKVITYENQKDDNSMVTEYLVYRGDSKTTMYNSIMGHLMLSYNKRNGTFEQDEVEILDWEKEKVVESLLAGIDILLPDGSIVPHELAQPYYKYKECNLSNSLFTKQDKEVWPTIPLFKHTSFNFGNSNTSRKVDFYFYIRKQYKPSKSISNRWGQIKGLYDNFNSSLENTLFKINFIESVKSDMVFIDSPVSHFNVRKFYDQFVGVNGIAKQSIQLGGEWIKVDGDGNKPQTWKLSERIHQLVGSQKK